MVWNQALPALLPVWKRREDSRVVPLASRCPAELGQGTVTSGKASPRRRLPPSTPSHGSLGAT